MDRIDSYDRRKKSEINHMFMQADLIANRVAKCFDPQKVKTVMPWDYFPEVFEKERKEYEQQEVITVKNRRRAAMDEYNRRRHMQAGGENE